MPLEISSGGEEHQLSLSLEMAWGEEKERQRVGNGPYYTAKGSLRFASPNGSISRTYTSLYLDPYVDSESESGRLTK